jgi:hypothetical protein
MESAQMATYNGHKNWNHWNVSLWINNDEGLYNLARRMRRGKGAGVAAKGFISELQERGITSTPDGAPYTLSAVRSAMVGL